MKRISFDNAAAHLDTIWDQVERSGTPVMIRRGGHEDMALLPAADLRGLRETVHLLRSPRNAARLLTAIARSRGEEPPDFRIR